MTFAAYTNVVRAVKQPRVVASFKSRWHYRAVGQDIGGRRMKSMQFGHDDSATAESLRQKSRSGGCGASLYRSSTIVSHTRLNSSHSASLNATPLDRIAPTIAAGAYTRVGTGIAVFLSSREENLCRAFLRTKPSEQRRFKNGS